MRYLHPSFIRLVVAAGVWACGVTGAEWPGYRGGPEHTGVFNEPGLPRRLPVGGPRILWRAEVGTGFSGPAVSGSRVFLSDYVKVPEPSERILAFDARTGQPLWTNDYPCRLKIVAGYGNGPRATPTVEGGQVLVLGAMGHLSSVDTATGRLRWRHDFRTEYQATPPPWGYSAAPLVDGSRVIATVSGAGGASVMAFDLKSGRERWRALEDIAGYASPEIIRVGTRRELIIWTGPAVNALDPETGRLLWRVPRKLAWDQATACPIWDARTGLLLCSSDREGCLALRLHPAPPWMEPVWDRPTFSLLHGSAVKVGDAVYGIHHNGSDVATCGEFRCIEIATGDLRWSVRSVTPVKLHTTAHVAYNEANRVFYVNNEPGELVLGEVDAAGWHELGRGQLNGRSWSQAAYARRRIYHRAETRLVCASLE